MRVLFLSTDFKPRPGGIAELSHQMACGLAHRGHQVVVATEKRHAPGWDDGVQPYAVRRVLGVRRLLSRRNPVGLAEYLVWFRRSRRCLRRVLAEVTPDTVVACNYNTLWLSVLTGTNVPFFQYIVGEDAAGCIRPRASVARRQMIRALRRADGIIAISRYAQRLALSLGAEFADKVSVVPCGVPVGSIVPLDSGNGRQGSRLLTVARLELRKGIDTTLRAVATLADTLPSLRYTIVGSGPDRDVLERLAQNLGIEDRVEFTGFVDSERKHALYLASDVYVMPSRPGQSGECEGFGISFIEANAYGLPVVGSRAGGIPDAVEDGVNGLLVPPDDASSLADAIATLLGCPDLRRRMAEAGQDRIRKHLNWERIADNVEAKLYACLRQTTAQPTAPNASAPHSQAFLSKKAD